MNNYIEKINKIQREIQKVIIGKEQVIEQILTAIIAKGHILLEDIPGVGKTTLAIAFSRALSLQYRRTQFTPDVLPSDVTGFSLYNKQTNSFEYVQGAAMCNLYLADEINRTSPKTQSALLEIMEEGKVTVDGVTREIPKPFTVIATQNPIGSIGTQKLPESQMDRFMIRLSMGYPDIKSEICILKGEQDKDMESISSVVTEEELSDMQSEAEKIYVKDCLYEYIAKIVWQTRENNKIRLGISTRGGIALLRMAKAKAYMKGRDYMIPEDVLAVYPDVAGHRIALSPSAKAEGLTEEDVLDEARRMVNMPSEQ